jgi:FkbM family methyltransferase
VSQLKSGDICIDLGANVGLVSEMFLSRGAEVFAFEPHPEAFKKLLEIKRQYEKLRPINRAAGITEGKIKLYLHESHHLNPVKFSTGSSLMDSKPNVGREFIVSEATNFAEFLSRFQRIRILKIDIEGYEVELLPHLIYLGVLKNIDYIFVETHEKKWPQLTKKTNEMKQLVSESSFHEQIRWDWP